MRNGKDLVAPSSHHHPFGFECVNLNLPHTSHEVQAGMYSPESHCWWKDHWKPPGDRYLPGRPPACLPRHPIIHRICDCDACSPARRQLAHLRSQPTFGTTTRVGWDDAIEADGRRSPTGVWSRGCLVTTGTKGVEGAAGRPPTPTEIQHTVTKAEDAKTAHHESTEPDLPYLYHI